MCCIACFCAFYAKNMSFGKLCIYCTVRFRLLNVEILCFLVCFCLRMLFVYMRADYCKGLIVNYF